MRIERPSTGTQPVEAILYSPPQATQEPAVTPVAKTAVIADASRQQRESAWIVPSHQKIDVLERLVTDASKVLAGPDIPPREAIQTLAEEAFAAVSLSGPTQVADAYQAAYTSQIGLPPEVKMALDQASDIFFGANGVVKTLGEVSGDGGMNSSSVDELSTRLDNYRDDLQGTRQAVEMRIRSDAKRGAFPLDMRA